MPSVSERFVSSGAGARRGVAAAWAAPALGLLSLLAGLVAGCTEPQSGAFASHWCHPNAADAQTYVLLDDMEDGNSVPCSGAGNWTIDGTPDFTPVGESVGGPAVPTLLSSTDEATLDPMLATAMLGPSFRAQYLHGTVGPGGYGSLILPLAAPDLSAFQEIDFWAHSDTAVATVRVGVITTAADYFYEDVTIQPVWGDSSAPLLGALVRLDGTPVTAADLAQSAKIEFRFPADSNGDPLSFGFWIDDVLLKRSPTP